MTSEEYLKEKNIEKFLDPEGGINIEGKPEFVFKTLEKNKEKFFINIMTHPVIGISTEILKD
jgi:hypothetical protein